MRDGWNLTGDSFWQDEEGRFHFAARSDDMIISAGYNIAGPEVEAALLSHPAVLECAVVGVADEERGQIVEAHVVLAPGHQGDAHDGQVFAGSCEIRDRALQVPAQHRLHGCLAEDPDGQDPALPAGGGAAVAAPNIARLRRPAAISLLPMKASCRFLAAVEKGSLMAHARLRLNDGHAIPQVGLGIWQVPEAKTAETVAAALRLGYRLIDGAAIYGNEAGLGDGLRLSGVPRDEVFVTSKVWNTDQGHDATLRAVETSLKRLSLDRLDLCLIHWPVPARDLYVDTWRALIRLREEGRVRSIGVSNFMGDHLERIIGETGAVPVVNQIELNPRLQQAGLRRLHDRLGVVTQSWTPLGQGQSFAAAPVRSAAERTGKSPAQVILRWHVQLGVSVIPRSTRMAGLAENIDVFGFSLTPAEMAGMASLDEGIRCGPDPLAFG